MVIITDKRDADAFSRVTLKLRPRSTRLNTCRIHTRHRIYQNDINIDCNKDQRNPVKGGLADRFCHVVNHNFRKSRAITCFSLVFNLPGQRLHLTHCVLGPYKCIYQMPFKSVEQFKQKA